MNLNDRADETLKAITDTSEKLDNLHEKPEPFVTLIRASSITPKPIRWLWSPFLPQGKLVMFAGPSGAGKTTLALRMAATVTSGSMWPDGTNAL
jgi:putative DNA primase/helicase